MSQGEVKVLDSGCRFALAVSEGVPNNRLTWHTGRVLITSDRLVLTDGDRKRQIELDTITSIGGPADVGVDQADAPAALSLTIGETIFLVEPADRPHFAEALFGSILHGFTVSVADPSTAQDGPEWVEGHLNVESNAVKIALASGDLVALDLPSVTDVSVVSSMASAPGERVLTVEQTDEGRQVETRVAGGERHLKLLATYLSKQYEEHHEGSTLGEAERHVLRALESGVNPLKLPEVLDISADAVERTVDRLLEAEAVEVVRVRREVSLTDEGRTLAARVDRE